MKNAIRQYIEHTFIVDSTSGLGDDDSLLDRQILDSTGFIELVAFIESRFGLHVADEEMVPENLETIGSIAAFVLRKGGRLN